MTLLDKILDNKRQEVAARKLVVPETEVLHQAYLGTPRRGFASTVMESTKKPALIAEVKKASPSKGIIREDFDPVEIARAYERGGASCISVLTDERFFKGRLEHLSRVKSATRLPVLCKDFILEPYQIFEAAAAGADAILLIARAFRNDPRELNELALTATEFQMDILLEVHDEEELRMANGCRYDLLGINNRDLASFETDLEVTERLMRLVPRGQPVVAESGIQSYTDVQRLGRAGVSAVLVGESLLRQQDVEAATRQLLGL